ncbi:hypothetical protein BH23GEM6_BH23GEM6_27930 [soil metagenome]
MALVDAGVLEIRLRIYVEGVGAENSSFTPGPSAAVAPPNVNASPVVSSVTHAGALGRLVLARRVVEFIGSAIPIVTTASAVILWLLRS